MRAALIALLCITLVTACGPAELKLSHPLDRPVLEATYRTPTPGPVRQITSEEIVAKAKQNLLEEMRRLPKNKLAVSEYLGMKSVYCDLSIWQTGSRNCVHEASLILAILYLDPPRMDYRFDITVEDWLDPEKTLEMRLSKKKYDPDAKS